MRQFVSELLMSMRIPIGVIFNNVIHRRSDCPLTYGLAYKEEVISFFSSDHRVDDSTGYWIIKTIVWKFGKKSCINTFGHNNETEFDWFAWNYVLNGVFDLFQFIFINIFNITFRYAVAINND